MFFDLILRANLTILSFPDVYLSQIGSFIPQLFSKTLSGQVFGLPYWNDEEFRTPGVWVDLGMNQ